MTLSFILFIHCSSNGSCEPYYKHRSVASICDTFYNPDIDYIYIPKQRLRGSKYLLRQFMEGVNFLPDECREIAVRIMCVHYYLPCGANGTLHIPLPICPEVCRYMSETLCPNTWQFSIGFLASNQVALEYRYDVGILLPPCNDTGKLIDYLNLTSDCCSDGSVVPATASNNRIKPAATGKATVKVDDGDPVLLVSDDELSTVGGKRKSK